MERAIDLLVELTLHGVVAALAVELLIRRLPVTDLDARARARLFVLALPLASVPLLHLAWPGRATAPGADLLLLASSRWNAFTPGGWPLRDAVFGVFAAIGLGLLLRDAGRDIALAIGARRGRHERPSPAGAQEDWLRAAQQVCDDVARGAGVAAVPLRACDGPGPVLAARGILRPHIVISAAVTTRLQPEPLRAALAHELSHVVRRDVAKNALLEVLRTLQGFNPIAQVVARRIALEREWRADDDAVRWTGRPTALARALIESVRGRGGDFLGVLGRARIAALEVRCHRLLDPPVSPAAPSRLETAIVGAAVVLIVALVR